MRFDAGRFDTLITFEVRTATQDPVYGTNSYSWATFAQEMADIQDVLPSRAEKLADGINIQRRPCRIRTKYRQDITSDMRITFAGRTVQIVAGPVETGHRRGLEMMCEDYSTEGDQP